MDDDIDEDHTAAIPDNVSDSIHETPATQRDYPEPLSIPLGSSQNSQL